MPGTDLLGTELIWLSGYWIRISTSIRDPKHSLCVSLCDAQVPTYMFEPGAALSLGRGDQLVKLKK
jgi:hypothetical protein